MTGDEIDRLLIETEDLVPSAGFAASVMDAVLRESSTPPPIPFPWRPALPGLVAMIVAIALMMWNASPRQWSAFDSAYTHMRVISSYEAAPPEGWLLFSTIITLVPLVLSLRVMQRRL